TRRRSPDNNLAKRSAYFRRSKELKNNSNTSSWTNLFGKAYPEHSLGNTDVVNELALGWYAVDAEGNLLTRSRTGWQRPSGWESVLSTAEEYSIRTEMVVHEVNRERMLNQLLENEEAVKHAVEQITAEAAQHYSGVNLNLEGLGLSETGEQLTQVQNSFTRLITLLAESLQSRGLTLTLTIHAPNSVYKGYDYAALGRVADRIIIMAYDYGPRPEPNSLVIQAIEQALRHIPKEKLVLGVSIPSETPESMLTKVGIAKRYRLNGIALWRLGLLTDEMWNALRTTVRL
ncbi:MAG: glycosyl hydrolase family 18 protein, partial [Bacillota bacterium]|nr:glycosyl hydrolase family 18 protein [Bacillota bacterium]